jgi:hypothetical protein
LSEPVPPASFSLDALAKSKDSNNLSVKDFAHDTHDEQTVWVHGLRRSGSGSTIRDTYDDYAVAGPANDDKTIISTIDQATYHAIAKPRRSQTFHERSNGHAFDTPKIFVRRLAEIGLLPYEDETVLVGKRIRNTMAQSYLRHKFVPITRIDQFVTEDAVQFELSKANRSMTKISRIRKSPIVAKECASYRKILAILHLMKRPSKIRLFVKYRVCDSDLPLIDAACPTGPRSFYELKSQKSGSSVRFKKHADAIEFLERQWSVLVPFFHGSDGSHIPHNNFGSDVILPFISLEETTKEGGSGRVIKVEIHPDHHSLKKEKVGWTRPKLRFSQY